MGMVYEDYKENVSHGTASFPMAAYDFNGTYKYTVNDHWHKETEIILFEEGSFSVSLNEADTVIHAPAILFLPAGYVHGLTLKPGQKEKALVFDENLLVEPVLKKIKCEYLLIEVFNPLFAELSDIFSKAFREAGKGNDQSLLKARLYITEFVTELLDEKYIGYRTDLAENENTKDIIVRAKDYIQEHYDEKLLVSELADKLKLNNQYLCRLFKKSTGKTITEYVNEVRINKAEKLLYETDDKVIDIALATGYDNISYFIKRFKQQKGMTPNEYRTFR